jgi:hypothetical protein
MKLLLSCDDVFERLTRGPFPAPNAIDRAVDRADEAVDDHLRVCYECRQLAEALRPAVELLHESYSDTPADPTLPMYRGEPYPLARTPEEAAVMIERASPSGLMAAWIRAGHVTAACLLGIVMGCILAGGWISPDAKTPYDSQESMARGVTSEGASDLRGAASLAALKLQALKLQEVCWSPTGSASSAVAASVGTAEEATASCCTDCHSATASQAKGIDVARLQLACMACHVP